MLLMQFISLPSSLPLLRFLRNVPCYACRAVNQQHVKCCCTPMPLCLYARVWCNTVYRVRNRGWKFENRIRAKLLAQVFLRHLFSQTEEGYDNVSFLFFFFIKIYELNFWNLLEKLSRNLPIMHSPLLLLLLYRQNKIPPPRGSIPFPLLGWRFPTQLPPLIPYAPYLFLREKLKDNEKEKKNESIGRITPCGNTRVVNWFLSKSEKQRSVTW